MARFRTTENFEPMRVNFSHYRTPQLEKEEGKKKWARRKYQGHQKRLRQASVPKSLKRLLEGGE